MEDASEKSNRRDALIRGGQQYEHLSGSRPQIGDISPIPDALHCGLSAFLRRMEFTSRRRIANTEAGSAATIASSAMLASMLVAAIDEPTQLGLDQRHLEHLDRVLRRVFRTNAVSQTRVNRIAHAAHLLLSGRFDWLEHLNFTPGVDWGPAKPLLDLAFNANDMLAERKSAYAEVWLRRAAAVGDAAGIGLHMVARMEHLKALERIGKIQIAVFEDFSGYFKHMAAVIQTCSAALGHPFELVIRPLEYRRLHDVAVDSQKGCHLVMLDDPWLSEVLGSPRKRVFKHRALSAHVMMLAIHRKYRGRLEELAGSPLQSVTRELLMRASQSRRCGDLTENPTLLLPNGTLQEAYTVARQVCNAGAVQAASMSELREAYNDVRLSAERAGFKKLDQPTILEHLGAGKSFSFAPVFLGHAVATSPNACDLQFIPFAGGGVSGTWHLAALEGPDATTMDVVAELLADPIDRSVQLDHGIWPVHFIGREPRRRSINQFYRDRVAAIDPQFVANSFSRYTGGEPFTEVAAAFNRTIGMNV